MGRRVRAQIDSHLRYHQPSELKDTHIDTHTHIETSPCVRILMIRTITETSFQLYFIILYNRIYGTA